MELRRHGRLNMESLMHERLAQIAKTSEQDLNLAEAALLIAIEEYPGLDVDAYLRQIDELATSVQQRLPAQAGLEDTLVTLNQYLFVEQGFSGDTENYDDPRNSFLNEVLDRKRGIPITLSIIYMEVGRRLGLPLKGVSFPGHFLVKFATREGEVVLDPFSGGSLLSKEDLEEILEETYGPAESVNAPLERLLTAAGKKEILVRMLRNLKGAYLRREQFDKALSVVDQILLIQPEQPDEVRDRGRIYEQLECFRAALENYQSYLSQRPGSGDAPDVHKRIAELRQIVANLN
ncbi:MAG: tetratricopeptide repeat protein [Sulfuricaulis sp.]|uniref:SirB1 family protein n=1 Tax=Sulfuricaulis sp. TaxID=2003553 RepID=UPI0025D56F39|nr:tetratricopeptide repeat protein [Sulfuricaulis sp.]MCR4348099.1 tetratricopeptide repeat protein [Sulfuricaulis sp.]